MYCSNCGKQIPDNSMFCPECGEKVAQKAVMPKVAEAVTPSAGVAAFNAQRVKCPCCGGHNLQTVSEVTTVSSTTGGGYSGSKGCLGLLLFGPFGLLCGNCGNAQKTEVTNNTKLFWVCGDCGHKFEHLENIQKEKSEICYDEKEECTLNHLTKSGTERFRENILPFTGKCVIVPSLTVV